jgi:pilus assembly protein Flp/PilA
MTDLFTQVTMRLQNAWANLREREDGQTMVEYGLLLAGIAILVIAAVLLLGDNIQDLFEETANSLESPVGG